MGGGLHSKVDNVIKESLILIKARCGKNPCRKGRNSLSDHLVDDPSCQGEVKAVSLEPASLGDSLLCPELPQPSLPFHQLPLAGSHYIQIDVVPLPSPSPLSLPPPHKGSEGED